MVATRSESPRVVNDAEHSRYEVLSGDDCIGVAEYRIDPTGTAIDFTHTYVEPSRRGIGFAETLVDEAVGDARRRGLDVRASCWYVREYLANHD